MHVKNHSAAALTTADDAAGLYQPELLKRLEKTTADLFQNHQAFEAARHILGTEHEQSRCDSGSIWWRCRRRHCIVGLSKSCA